MTSQGRHRPQPHQPVPFSTTSPLGAVMRAVQALEAKGYEVRQVKLTITEHGTKNMVVLYLSPAPTRAWRVKNGPLSHQNVGATHRRNVETLLAYVESLPEVQPCQSSSSESSSDLL